ncbi:MAG TPA: hypothetical protein ENH94_09865 [Phycisphaerales bacterium]|nr:hypothetical protein [Phycisphaerales bacterium]
MKTKREKFNNRRGTALIIAMVFVIIFSALSVGMVTMTLNNARSSVNHRTSNRAFENAHSGLEYIRYWLGRVAMPGTTAPGDRFSTLVTAIETDLNAVGLATTMTLDEFGDPTKLAISDFSIDTDQSFTVEIEKDANLDILNINIEGEAGEVERNLNVKCNFGTRTHTVFDFGVATKGPLELQGNIELNGTNVAVEADVYIESANSTEALSIIGNSQIAGDVQITNPDATVYLQGGQAGIGGETGNDAIENHVDIGVDDVEFPVPNPGYFEQYVETTFDPAVEDTSLDNTYRNIRIPGGTNPTFSGNTIIEGIIYIETPNIVTFTGNADIRGLVVGDGDIEDNSGTNQLIFQGSISSTSVSDLDEDFGTLRDETGTFLMAPGFSVGFGGNFSTLNGAIAANGITFFGNAGGTIGGSVLNYSDTPMVLSGNSDLFFNRSGVYEVPAGFGPEIILHYNTASYREGM